MIDNAKTNISTRIKNKFYFYFSLQFAVFVSFLIKCCMNMVKNSSFVVFFVCKLLSITIFYYKKKLFEIIPTTLSK